MVASRIAMNAPRITADSAAMIAGIDVGMGWLAEAAGRL
jgi:hypothetical protein